MLIPQYLKYNFEQLVIPFMDVRELPCSLYIANYDIMMIQESINTQTGTVHHNNWYSTS